jgi:hypothetical protein
VNLTLAPITFKAEPGMFMIDDMLTFDMELYFTLDELTSLYSFDTNTSSGVPQYLSICELASGDYPECQRSMFNDDNFQDFLICVQSKLSMLSCFNYLSESKLARNNLY